MHGHINLKFALYTLILLLHPIICAAGSYLPVNYERSLDITQFTEQDHREIPSCSETLQNLVPKFHKRLHKT